MLTLYLRGTTPRQDDQQITERLRRKIDISLGGKTMRIGIRNEAGVIYRSIEAQGPGQIIEVVQALHDLGFKDELEQAAHRRYGVYGIFGK